MSDNVLKKDFQQRDVQRLRNLVQGKYGDKVGESVGYTKAEEFHKEGDIWEVDGRKWTIKDGIKQNITKLDEAKKSHVMPLFCPTCKGLMDVKFDKDYYNIHKKCFNCVLDFEFALRKAGLFEEYEKNIINSEIDGFIVSYRDYVESKLKESNDSFITEQGDVEKWEGGLDKRRVLEALDKTIEHLQKMKK
tara:strand:+ start:623 stop:1195 length:573 start_codon:yes stop_codon:yes gene_type:complete